MSELNIDITENIKYILKGDKEKFVYIIKLYEDKLYKYLSKFLYNKDDARGVLQNTFVKVYINLNSFDLNKNFNAWIYRIAHNEAINYLKKNYKISTSFIDIDEIAPFLFAKEDTLKNVEKDEIKKDIEKVLENIPPKYREVLILNFFEDMSYEEISDILKVPISTVGTRINRGKEKVRILLEKNN